MLRWIWSEAGGKLTGKVRAGSVPAGARLLMRVESEPLASLVRDMNKFSNNVMARHLFLALSAERQGPGEARASERILREWLAARAIEAPGFAIENGAGLSRDDRITAGTLTALLRNAWTSPVMPEIAASMPIFATDGTLKSRRAGSAAGQAHVKGGTLTGVQAVAGYVLDRSGRRWAVAMMVNHPKANAAQPALDALIEWVHAQGGESRMAR
jgi:D-alanyl-D-alanine carboxypeptidase/D-alanyl-D-alanine-endopeptidase (penicillin-binding protein 4)